MDEGTQVGQGGQGKSRPRSIRLSWIISYAMLLAVPILVFGLVSWATARTMEEQLAESSATLVELMGKEMDGQLEYVGRLINDITWDPRTQALMYQSGLDDPSKRYDMIKLSENLAAYNSYNRFSDFFFVHFPNLDSYLAPRAFYGSAEFGRIFLTGSSLDGEALGRLLSLHHDGDTLPFQYRRDVLDQLRQAVIIMKSLPPSPSSPVAATIGVIIDTATITDAIHKAIKASRSDIRIVNGQGQVILTTIGGSDTAQPGSVLSANEAPVINDVRIGNESYTLLQRQASRFDWTVQLLVPDSIIRGRLLFVQVIILIGVLASLGLGGLLTSYLIRRNYGPVRGILDSLAPESDNSQGMRHRDGDEFSIIRRAVFQAREERSRAMDRFEKNKEALRENLVSRLLRGELADGITLEDNLAALDVAFAGSRFVVLLTMHDELVPIQAAEGQPEAGQAALLARYLIHRGLAASLEPMATLWPSVDNDPQAFLVNLSPEIGPDGISWLQERIPGAGLELESQYGIRMMSALSGVVNDIAAIPQAFRQARTALEFRYVVGGNRPLAWDELQMKTASLYQFDLDSEARLMTAVKAGDQVAASEILDSIFADNSQPGRPILSPQAAKCLVWDLGGSIMKALAEIADGDESFGEIMDPLGSLTQDPRLEKARAGMQEILSTACAWAAQRTDNHLSQLKSDANRQFIAEVRDWLAANSRDPSLNLAKIAGAHGLTPAYLSRLFRENMEEGIFDHLNRIRIEQAKQFLRTTDSNLQDIGTECGFTDIKTFIRTFKKFVGTTPGKFRESAK